MDVIKNDMLKLYYANINAQAKKLKIIVNTPHLETIHIEPVSEVITDTEVILFDDYVYKKPWNKLNIIHKVIKIKEFINNIVINDPEIKKHLRTQLVDMVKKKKLTTKNDVEYDYINGKIISISSLQCKDNSYKILTK